MSETAAASALVLQSCLPADNDANVLQDILMKVNVMTAEIRALKEEIFECKAEVSHLRTCRSCVRTLYKELRSPCMPLGMSQSPPMPLGMSQSPPMPLGMSQSPPMPLGKTQSPRMPLGKTQSPPMPLKSQSPPMPLGK
ncbi:uncharacterized protein LOC119732923 [Patiria miniata]|uniref:Uncharacterized protein n=1 Tax=Patiria miniata TaxID=46514 RepID=A0A914AGC0_PATMI|nr:uncharacterized protein LOC119732923 [Patiria miniata]